MDSVEKKMCCGGPGRAYAASRLGGYALAPTTSAVAVLQQSLLLDSRVVAYEDGVTDGTPFHDPSQEFDVAILYRTHGDKSNRYP